MSENEEQILDVNNQDSEYNERFLKRFWSKVVKGENCWEWQGAIQSKGYGSISIKGRTYSAHRVSYELHFGAIPEGLLCLHKCDNPRCVRPDHLFLGTNRDNIIDMVQKGRHSKNKKNRKTKLTIEKVRQMRALYEEGDFTYKKLAENFGVSSFTVGATIRGEYWKLPLAE